eukprot:6189710-Pleurochrysis_carterae.AAC.2
MTAKGQMLPQSLSPYRHSHTSLQGTLLFLLPHSPSLRASLRRLAAPIQTPRAHTAYEQRIDPDSRLRAAFLKVP